MKELSNLAFPTWSEQEWTREHTDGINDKLQK